MREKEYDADQADNERKLAKVVGLCFGVFQCVLVDNGVSVAIAVLR